MYQLRCHTADNHLVCLYFDTPEEAERFATTELPAFLEWDMIEKF